MEQDRERQGREPPQAIGSEGEDREDAGKWRLEGRDYVVKEGDVIEAYEIREVART